LQEKGKERKDETERKGIGEMRKGGRGGERDGEKRGANKEAQGREAECSQNL